MTKRSGSSISGIGKGGLALFFSLSVELEKALLLKKNLSANVEFFRHLSAWTGFKPQRDGWHGFQLCGNILTNKPVSSG